MINLRIGFGLDIHKLENDHDFWLGGIKIPHSKGATGHSDADVLIHAICDALLGAANLDDIGTHFPDNSDEYKDIDSKILLKKVVDLLNANGFSIINIDTTIVLQNPKISQFFPEMKTILAETMAVSQSHISIKATTTEKLGYEGREEGISAYAITLIQKNIHD